MTIRCSMLAAEGYACLHLNDFKIPPTCKCITTRLRGLGFVRAFLSITWWTETAMITPILHKVNCKWYYSQMLANVVLWTNVIMKLPNCFGYLLWWYLHNIVEFTHKGSLYRWLSTTWSIVVLIVIVTRVKAWIWQHIMCNVWRQHSCRYNGWVTV